MKMYTKHIDLVIETKIKPNMKRIYEMRINGYTDKQIAKVLGLSLEVMTKAKEEYEEFREIYEEATQLLCTQLRDVAFSRALGTDGKVDKEGKEVGPDANLAFRLLEKMDPAFSRKESSGPVMVTVEHIIKEISAKRRMGYEEEKEEEEEVVA